MSREGSHGEQALVRDDSLIAAADNHVHTEWSWDAPLGDMDGTCRRALELGLPTVAFTEHADFVRGPTAVFDPEAYHESVARCRTRYPDLRILSGVELGEPHKYLEETKALLSAGFDRVLASVHGVIWNGRFTDACEKGFLSEHNLDAYLRLYLEETLALVQSDVGFEVLAHLDYPKRYLPEGFSYDPATYQGEFRAILRTAAQRGIVLELNTTRGGQRERYMCPELTVVKWWREEGGCAVSFGSDAHCPEDLAKGFALASEIAEAAGFRPRGDMNGFWTR
jgi:histidinol-phosphatase (PHP family)